MNTSIGNPPYGASRTEFLRLSKWFTLALCAIAFILPVLAGQQGVWAALQPEDLVAWPTALSGLSGIAAGAFVSLLVVHWRPLNGIVRRLTVLVDWKAFQAWDYFLVALLAAFGEELLFRGAIQPLVGLVPTAVIFGLLHATGFAHIVLAGVLGLCLGSLYNWSGSLWPPIAAHLTLDMITGLVLAHNAQLTLRADRGD
jgi:membrane protease YdiL (CAAX protease family)